MPTVWNLLARLLHGAILNILVHNVAIGRMSKFAISRNFEIITAGRAGNLILRTGIRAMICWASTSDQI